MGLVTNMRRACSVLAMVVLCATRVFAAETTLLADAHVNSAQPGVNSGAISNLAVGAGFTTLIQFDLSMLPAGTSATQVSRAVLRLYCNRVTTPGLVGIEGVGGAWGEYSVTYATVPPLGSAAQVFSVRQAGTYLAVDITDMVRGWVASPASNNGLALSAGTAAVEFDSKENDLTGHAPALSVDLVLTGPTGATGAAGPIGVMGQTGPAGVAGPTGLAGSPGAAGALGFTYSGNYSPTVSYGVGDVVLFGGSSYVSLLAANLGNTPGQGLGKWGLVAQGGSGTGLPGPPGPAGPTGATGSAGRLMYQGVYSPVVNYTVDDIVTFDGSSFLSLVAGNYGHTPGVSPMQWALLAQGATPGTGKTSTISYQGVYSSTSNYGLDDIVIYQGSSYVSLLAGNRSNTPSASPGQWGLLSQGSNGASGTAGPAGPPGLTYRGTYASTTGYSIGDVVAFEGSSYVSLSAANSGNAPGLSPAQWGVLASGVASGPTGPAVVGIVYQGSYSTGTNYGLNDIVIQGGSSYISLLAGNRGNTPNQSPAAWGLLAQGGNGMVGATGAAGPQGAAGVPGLGFAGTYVSSANYGLSDVVGFQGSSYISLLAGNRGNSPASSPGMWGLLAAAGTGQIGAQGVTGSPGAAGVTGPAGPVGLVGIAGPIGLAGAPGAPGLVYRGAYSSASSYTRGDVVLWQGASYSSLLDANQGNTPSLSPQGWGALTSQGPQGLQGAPGATGPTGTQGLPGLIGTGGETGAAGPQGISGQPGARGLIGATGVVGLSGPAGPQGVAGSVGLSMQGAYSSTRNYALAEGVTYNGGGYVSLVAANYGNTPDQNPSAWGLFAAPGGAGPSGPAGVGGAVGAAGAAGPQGISGSVGLPGATGATGPAVANYVGAYNSATSYGLRDAVSFAGSTYVSLVAANHGNTPDASAAQWAVLAGQGIAGPAGSPGASGVAGPPGLTGPIGLAGPPASYRGGWATGVAYSSGDAVSYAGSSYVAVTGNQGRQPDLSSASWAVLSQAGSPGMTGATGATGFQGPTGYPGPAGAIGAIGPAGATGLAGAAGSQGLAGPAGAAGVNGRAGVDGAQGGAGAMGPLGPQGPAATFRGIWAAGTTYAVGEAVSYGGSSYVALGGNAGRVPDASPQVWGVLAQGSAGPAGVAGIQGASGFAGPVGAMGPSGPAGVGGAPGAAGPQGFQGAAGSAGIPGAAGGAGPAGIAGSAGVQGPQGPPVSFKGYWATNTSYATGDAIFYGGSSFIAVSANSGRQPDLSPVYWALLAQQGGAGPVGVTGATGSQGPTGYPGPAGSAGPTGGSGPVGPSGAAGGTGPAGPAGASGVAGPVGGAGLVYRGAYGSGTSYSARDGVEYQGSSYVSLVDSNTGQTPGLSPSAWSLLAAQGGVGPAGSNGASGPQGQAGLVGPAGPQGSAGPTGASGATGAAGPSGTAGVAGAAGAAGVAGLVYRGTYDPARNYALHDGVNYHGSSYLSLVAGNAGQNPESTTGSWDPLALVGAVGAAGTVGGTGAQGQAGVVGPAGPAGAAGAAGTNGTNGAAGLTFRGPYSAGTNYGVGDGVSFAGASYLSQAGNNLGNVPGSGGGQWGLLAQAGATGPSGSAGATGAAGGVGATGAAGATGSAGATGAPGLIYRSGWTIQQTYATSDTVVFGGASYVALASNSGSEPDLYPGVWDVLAARGGAGASGPSGAGASVAVGTVTTGAAGSSATVTNSGTAAAAVLDFTIPAGATGPAGVGGSGGGAGTSGVPFVSMYHGVSFSTSFYSVNNPNSSPSEPASVLTWIPAGCVATKLTAFSQQANTVTVRLRTGSPGSMADAGLFCTATSGGSCSVTGSVTIPAGNFVDLTITGPNGTVAGVWTALACN